MCSLFKVYKLKVNLERGHVCKCAVGTYYMFFARGVIVCVVSITILSWSEPYRANHTN